MIKVTGKYQEAIIYTDIVYDKMLNQIKELLDLEIMKNAKVRIMPDCHSGIGCVIGTTMTIKDKVIPNLVGVDIGCGMLCVNLGKINLDFTSLDEFIHHNIPAGMNVNEKETTSNICIENLKCFNNLKKVSYLKKSLGSLGGGNHFIEIDINDAGEYFLIIHSGSRNLGNQVAKVYQDKAILKEQNKILNKSEEIDRIINEYKKNGKQKEIQKDIKKIRKMNIEIAIPKELCYLEGDDFNNYIFDMDICQKYASENRFIMAKKIVDFLELDINKLKYFETIHNYINMKDMILRKGAISAYKDEIVLIPLNMKDGCIIAKGKGNPDYNYSAPHGAGRIMSRKEAIRNIKLDDYVKSMKSIYSTTIDKSTIDESPFAYKPKEMIIKNILDTVDIIDIMKPVYNFKANEE